MNMPLQSPLQPENQSDAVQRTPASTASQQRGLVDSRPAGVEQRKLTEMMNNSSRVLQQRALSDAIHNSPRMVAQRHKINALFGVPFPLQEDDAMPAQLSPVQREEKPNHTGLPNQLKSGIESLSGMSMDHVKVHYNSDKPAQLQAYAYAQGSEIYLGSGQERHLPHEAWHVVQQAQGRVRPMQQIKGGGGVNNDRGLEAEADLMGGRALLQKGMRKDDPAYETASAPQHPFIASANTLVQRVVIIDKKNIEMKDLKSLTVNTKEKNHLAKLIKDKLTHSFANLDGFKEKFQSDHKKIDPASILPLTYRERHTALRGVPYEHGDIFYRAVSEDELINFTKKNGLAARLKDGKETGQQFISSDLEYSIKIAQNNYQLAVLDHSPEPLKDYRYMLKLDYGAEMLEYVLGHQSTRVGSGDKTSQDFFKNTIPEQGKQDKEKEGVMIIKMEPVGKGEEKRVALNIGFTPTSTNGDPRTELNKFLRYAEIHGEFELPVSPANLSSAESRPSAAAATPEKRQDEMKKND